MTWQDDELYLDDDVMGRQGQDDDPAFEEVSREEAFPGDAGDMSLQARRASIALKRGAYVSGALYDLVIENEDEVRRSLSNDLLVLRLFPRYRIALALPAFSSKSGETCLKRPSYVTARQADALCFCRERAMTRESAGMDAEDWTVSVDEMAEHYMRPGGPLGGSTSESAAADKARKDLDACCGKGYLEQVKEKPGLFKVTPLVLVAIDRSQLEQWGDQLDAALDGGDQEEGEGDER